MKNAAVIPTYNEEKHIPEVLERAALNTDLIIVCDHSTDRTPDIVRESGRAVLIRAKTRGKGAQLREGFARALEEGADLIIQIDGDGERAPEDIPRMFSALEGSGKDMAVARRDAMRSFRRRLLNLFGFFWIRLVTGYRIRDPFSGMIAFRREALERLEIRSTGFEIEPEIMLEAWRKSLSVSEVGVSSPSMSSSKFSLREMLRTNLFFDRWVIRNLSRLDMKGILILPFCFLGLASAVPLRISRLQK